MPSLMTLTCLKNTDQLFCRMSLILDVSDVFSWLDKVFGKKISDMMCTYEGGYDADMCYELGRSLLLP